MLWFRREEPARTPARWRSRTDTARTGITGSHREVRYGADEAPRDDGGNWTRDHMDSKAECVPGIRCRDRMDWYLRPRPSSSTWKSALVAIQTRKSLTMPRITPYPHRNMAQGQQTRCTILPSRTTGLRRGLTRSRRTEGMSVQCGSMHQRWCKNRRSSKCGWRSGQRDSS